MEAATEAGLFDHVIVNDSVEACVQRLAAIAEQARKGDI
jgi:guanylate kinase